MHLRNRRTAGIWGVKGAAEQSDGFVVVGDGSECSDCCQICSPLLFMRFGISSNLIDSTDPFLFPLLLWAILQLLLMLPTLSPLRFGALLHASGGSMMARRSAQSVLPASFAASASALSVAASTSNAMVAAASSAFLLPSRSAHFPRTVRGVGPAPRVASFWKQPWLRRRLASDRARVWNKTHPTAVLNKPVETTTEEAAVLPCVDLLTAQQTGTVTLSPSIFNVPLRRDIVWQCVRWQRACRRAGTHKTKDRSEVHGSGKKVRPQKGGGTARMADPHAPHHKGGGWAFPKRPSDYSYDLPREAIVFGKRVALSSKAAEGNLYIVDGASLPSHLPADFDKVMEKHRWGSFLMVHLEGELDPNLALACRKKPKYCFLSEKEFNVYDVS
jgi:large subunit ribosomal protein L4